jgi:WD40 repeat protein
MVRRLLGAVAAGAMLLGLSACDGVSLPGSGAKDSTENGDTTAADKPIGAPLFTPAPVRQETPAPASSPTGTVDPIVIPDARIAVYHKPDVPSMRDGVILFIGTPLKPGETPPPDREVRTVKYGGKDVQLKQLKEDDTVEVDQVMAVLDNRLATDEWAIKTGKIAAAKAEGQAADKTKDEAYQRKLTMERLYKSPKAGNVVSIEDVRGAVLLYDKSAYEAVSKKEAINVAELEANQARTQLELHLVKSPVAGVIKTVYKKTGESVKGLDPVFQVHNLDRLRAEGQLEAQYAYRLHKGMKADLEPSLQKPPDRVLLGHLQEINSVAVTKDKQNPLIVSGSEDGTVRVWDRMAGREQAILRHPQRSPIRAVACTPPAAKANLCLAGAADGSVLVWDLDSKNEAPVLQLKDHRSAVNCIAISPDGNWFATGGDDREIHLYATATGEKKYTLEGHRAGITALQITPRAQLLSSAKDSSFNLWDLGELGARPVATAKLDHRSGDVPQVNVSPEGGRVLFETGKTIRILSLPKGLTEGVLQNPSGAANFSTFALFSPDGRLILTTGGAEGRMQLWKAPTAANRRGHEIRRWVLPGATFSCATFAPDGTFAVSGTKDRQVLAWSVPSKEETDRKLTAEVSLVEQAVEQSGSQVRVWAEFDNPAGEGRLLPGTPVTLVINPKE